MDKEIDKIKKKIETTISTRTVCVCVRNSCEGIWVPKDL